MLGILQVIYIVVCYTISSSCYPLSPYSEQFHTNNKRPVNSVRSYNSTQELSRMVPNPFNGNLHYEIPLETSDNRQGGSFANDLGRIYPENVNNKNEIKKRGFDVGVLVNFPSTQQYDSSLEKLEALLNDVLANRLVEEKYNNTQGCPSCDQEVIVERIIKPAYECDEWDPKHRVCTLERNIGDTVTFYLSTGKDGGKQQPNVTWKKEFHMRDSKERKIFTIDHQNPPENVIIGRKGFEFRLSPITETDVAYNMFSATLQSHASFKSKLYFMIRIVAIDLGFVYVGEIIELNLRNFISMPEQSMTFKWYMEKDGEHGTLPSNMKVSITGSSIKISELRQEQEGILACSVYTNLRILATMKRFLIKDLSKNKDVLQSSPNHALIFKEEFREKRYPKQLLPGFLNSLRLSRKKRSRLAVEEVERALLQSTSKEEEIPSYTTSLPRYNVYNKYAESPQDDRQTFGENENTFQEISEDVDGDGNFPGNKIIGMPVNRKPVAVEESIVGQRILENPPPINEDLYLQAGKSIDEMDAIDDRPVVNQIDDIQMNAAGAFLNEPENEIIRKSQQYLVNKIPHENVPNQVQGGPLLDISVNPPYTQQKQNIPQSANDKSRMKYIELDSQAIRRKPNQQDGYSDIYVNISGMKESRKIIAEMQIAKLISYCFSYLECSAAATCVKSSAKAAGFCKCIPGANGVGIFCREEILLSNSMLNLKKRNLDPMAYDDASLRG